jgi:hypothetical protein
MHGVEPDANAMPHRNALTIIRDIQTECVNPDRYSQVAVPRVGMAGNIYESLLRDAIDCYLHSGGQSRQGLGYIEIYLYSLVLILSSLLL